MPSSLKKIRHERDTFGRLRADKLQDLRNLDNSRGADDADAETLADAILDAFDILNVDVEQQRLVAFFANDGGAEIANRTGQVMRDGLDERLNGVHCRGCRLRVASLVAID